MMTRPSPAGQCHPGTQENEADMVDCSQCHDDGYDPDMLDHA